MVLLLSLALAEVFLLLCAKPLKQHPAPFYSAAALASAAVIGLYWTAPDWLSSTMRHQLPLWAGALGTACFIEVMAVGAFPNGHPRVKRVMPVRGELSIFACLLTLGQNLSYGRNYLTPGYLLSGPLSSTKAAAWVSVVLIALMLVLTVTSIKAVRRRFSPKRWKAVQRWAYLFYGLLYVHVLLLNVPGFWKGRSGCGMTVLAYSAVFLPYALCRICKAILLYRGYGSKVTGHRQLAAAGVGLAFALLLVAGLQISLPGSVSVPPSPQTPEPIHQNSMEPVHTQEIPSTPQSSEPAEPQESAPEPESPPAPTPSPEPETELAPKPDSLPETAPVLAEPVPVEEAVSPPDPEPTSEPEPEPDLTPEPALEPALEPDPTPEPDPEPVPTPEPALKYQDGVFTGSGEGYYGTVTVSVAIASDVITSITIDSYMDDDDYFGDAQSAVVPAILSAQAPEVSAVSGATYSSRGIMAAVRDALAKAEN